MVNFQFTISTSNTRSSGFETEKYFAILHWGFFLWIFCLPFSLLPSSSTMNVNDTRMEKLIQPKPSSITTTNIYEIVKIKSLAGLACVLSSMKNLNIFYLVCDHVIYFKRNNFSNSSHMNWESPPELKMKWKKIHPHTRRLRPQYIFHSVKLLLLREAQKKCDLRISTIHLTASELFIIYFTHDDENNAWIS